MKTAHPVMRTTLEHVARWAEHAAASPHFREDGPQCTSSTQH